MQVSRTITTKGRKRAYVYQVGKGFDLMCTGCGYTDHRVGLAPALKVLGDHARTCTA